MIVDWILHNSGELLRWLMSFIPSDLQGAEPLNEIASYIQAVYTKGGDIFFLFVPQEPFKFAIDVLFFWVIHEPGWKAIMWVMRKIPFLGIE